MTIDLHLDTLWKMTKYGYFSLNKGGGYSGVSEAKLAKGGLQAAVFALYLPHHMECDADRAIDEQLLYLRRQNIPGFTFYTALENGELLLGSIMRLKQLAAAGIVYLTLTHNYNNKLGDSATDVPCYNGLTAFGKEVVRNCNELGVIVDVSHTADRTAWDALRASARPVIASHSGCRKVLDHPRNIGDALIKAIAASGGLVGVPFVQKFVGTKHGIIEHIDHIVQMVGTSHVAIGSDLDGAVMVDGVKDISNWWEVVHEGLSARGYTEDAIALIGGGNFKALLDNRRGSPNDGAANGGK